MVGNPNPPDSNPRLLYNPKFHIKIAEMSHSPTLSRLIRGLRLQCGPILWGLTTFSTRQLGPPAHDSRRHQNPRSYMAQTALQADFTLSRRRFSSTCETVRMSRAEASTNQKPSDKAMSATSRSARSFGSPFWPICSGVPIDRGPDPPPRHPLVPSRTVQITGAQLLRRSSSVEGEDFARIELRSGGMPGVLVGDFCRVALPALARGPAHALGRTAARE